MQDDVQLFEADLNINGSGDNTVVAAVAGKQIAIYKMWLVASAAVNVIFKTVNASAVPLTNAGSSMFFQFDGKQYFASASGAAFIINLSGGVQVTGRVYYALK